MVSDGRKIINGIIYYIIIPGPLGARLQLGELATILPSFRLGHIVLHQKKTAKEMAEMSGTVLPTEQCII